MAQVKNWDCPGGTGKKMKFCCPDLMSDWEKIFRTMDAQQYHACLELIEQLECRSPDRPCLLAFKIDLLYQLEKLSEAEQTVEHFLQKHPDNPAAMMEKAYLLAAQQQAEEAYQWLLRAMNAVSGAYPIGTPRALYLVALRLLAKGHYLPSLALIRFGSKLSGPVGEEFQEVVRDLESNRQMPLLLREAFDWRLDLLADTPAALSLFQIREQADQGHWLDAAQALEQLCQTSPEVPGLWWHLALMRSLILDTSGAIEALRQYARLDVPPEEAVLAEAVVLSLSTDPLKDQISKYKLTYTPEDEGHLQAALSLCKQLLPIAGPLPLAIQEDNGEPPPRACYLLLDRPVAGQEEPATETALSWVIGLAALYGRQTDREARLVIHNVFEHTRAQVEALFNQFVGQGLRPGVVAEEIGKVSATRVYFGTDVVPVRPRGQKPDRKQEKEYQFTEFLRRWLDQPLGIFQGRSPRQAAQDPQSLTVLEAVLLWMENLASEYQHPWDPGRVRQELTLSPREPIDPQTVSLRNLPLYRWIDLDLGKASDQQIVQGYLYASRFRWEPVMERFAIAFLERPSLAAAPAWGLACYTAATAAIPSDQAATFIEQGRQHALQLHLSCAAWDLLALRYHLERREYEQTNITLQHLVQHHQYEPGALEAAAELLETFGVLPAEPSEQTAPPGPSPGLWTPAQEEKNAEKKKLWTPDMS